MARPLTARLIVDGMNVIGSRPDGWWRDLDSAARTLVARLQRFVEATEADVTLVLDGRPIAGLPEGTHDGLRIAYGRSADDRIVEIVAGVDDPASIEVITSDRELQRRVEALGAHRSSPSALLRQLDGLE